MFISRENELASLNNLYASDKFEFAVIYGRRRVGKTALINEFVRDKKAIYFMGVESNAKQNLVQIHQGGICMGERSYYLEDDEATQKVRAAYRAYGRKLFALTGKSEAEAAKMMEAVEPSRPA